MRIMPFKILVILLVVIYNQNLSVLVMANHRSKIEDGLSHVK